jgi:hypothetical protein
MRTLTPAAVTLLNRIITAPMRLVELLYAPGGVPTVIRMSDAGDITVGLLTYIDTQLSFGPITFPGDAKPSGLSMAAGSPTGGVGLLVLNNDLTNAVVTIYIYDRALLGVEDPVLAGTFSIDGCRISLGKVDMTLRPPFYTAPARRVDAAHGFYFATPEGTQITWGNETTTLIRR